METDIPRPRNGSRISTVIQTIQGQLNARLLVPGERLPSIRQMAERLGFSKTTVVEAYDRMAADGMIVSKRGSGFFVCGHSPPLSLSNVSPVLDRSIDPLWIIRQSLEAETDLLEPGCGWLPSSWLPDSEIRRALRQVAREPQSELFEYGRPYGHPGLREQLARRFAEHGILASPRQIILTDSGTQSIDLVCRFLLEPGDTVLIDDPGYFNYQSLLRAHRVQLIGIPYSPQGPDVQVIQELLVRHHPRLYITNSVFHNPTGAVLAPVVVHHILKLAETHNLLIIEDDIFADLEVISSPRLAAFDGLNRVIQIGSFSKTLSASVRCGYIAVRPDWAEQIVDLKLATTFGNSAFGASLVDTLLRQGAYRHHIGALRNRLADAMGLTLHRLKKLGIQPWMEPQGGMFLWVRLPGGLQSATVSREALRQGVLLAPGDVFSLSQSASSFLRFNVAQCHAPRIFDVLAQAMEKAA